MKRKVLLSLLVLIMVVTITGCGKTNSKSNNTVEKKVEDKGKSEEKVTFTVDSKHKNVIYKLPEGGESGFFKDLGHSCTISYYTNQTSVAALYPYDNEVEKVNKVTINDFTYETYKYIDNFGSHYVYRTKVNNDYHLFTYDSVSKEYDDTQVEKFMDTVKYTYDKITYKQK